MSPLIMVVPIVGLIIFCLLTGRYLGAGILIIGSIILIAIYMATRRRK